VNGTKNTPVLRPKTIETSFSQTRPNNINAYLTAQLKKWRKWTLSSVRRSLKLKDINLSTKGFRWNWNKANSVKTRCRNMRLTLLRSVTKIRDSMISSETGSKRFKLGRPNLLRLRQNCLYWPKVKTSARTWNKSYQSKWAREPSSPRPSPCSRKIFQRPLRWKKH